MHAATALDPILAVVNDGCSLLTVLHYPIQAELQMWKIPFQCPRPLSPAPEMKSDSTMQCERAVKM